MGCKKTAPAVPAGYSPNSTQAALDAGGKLNSDGSVTNKDGFDHSAEWHNDSRSSRRRVHDGSPDSNARSPLPQRQPRRLPQL